MFSDTWETDGVSNSIKRARRSLESRGHKVYVFAPSSKGLRGWHGNDFYLKGWTFPFYQSYKLCFWPEDLTKAVKEKHIDVIHIHTPAFIGVKGMLVAFREKIPCVFTYHTDFLFALGVYIKFVPFVKTLGKVFLRYFLKHFEAIVYPSQFTKKDVISWLKVPAKEYVFPTGIDTDAFQPCGKIPKSVRWAKEKGKKIILITGRVAPEKNYPLIFRAVDYLPKDYVLFVAGHGPALAEYRRKFASDRIRFLGFVPDQLLPGLYSSADCFVLASKFETQCMVLDEAMACGCPVASINYGPMPETVDESCGRLFYELPRSVANGIMEVVSHPELRKGALAKASANNLSVFVARLEMVYKQVA